MSKEGIWALNPVIWGACRAAGADGSGVVPNLGSIRMPVATLSGLAKHITSELLQTITAKGTPPDVDGGRVVGGVVIEAVVSGVDGGATVDDGGGVGGKVGGTVGGKVGGTVGDNVGGTVKGGNVTLPGLMVVVVVVVVAAVVTAIVVAAVVVATIVVG
jgi:hypothetical protein